MILLLFRLLYYSLYYAQIIRHKAETKNSDVNGLEFAFIAIIAYVEYVAIIGYLVVSVVIYLGRTYNY